MALARVVAFDGVTDERIEQLRQEIGEGGLVRTRSRPPRSWSCTTRTAKRSLAIVFFDNEEDYRRGDAALGAMPAGDTPGSSASRSTGTPSPSACRPESPEAGACDQQLPGDAGETDRAVRVLTETVEEVPCRQRRTS